MTQSTTLSKSCTFCATNITWHLFLVRNQPYCHPGCWRMSTGEIQPKKSRYAHLMGSDKRSR